MCGRFTLRVPVNIALAQFLLEVGEPFRPRYNIAPTQSVPVARLMPSRAVAADASSFTVPAWIPRLDQLPWGLVPVWAKTPRQNPPLINARCETVATKPAFRAAFKRRRCLVPADGYFEWRKEGQMKQPYFIRMRDEGIYWMAGLWERWQPASAASSRPIDSTDSSSAESRSGDSHPAGSSPGDTTSCDSFAILTTAGNELTQRVHDRMPVILRPEHYELWLSQEPLDEASFAQICAPFDSAAMHMDRVSRHVNSPRHDDPECVQVVRELF